jgi:uncharacterized membrane protein YeaQ/YmgE (transglycosylase-associated protein family)
MEGMSMEGYGWVISIVLGALAGWIAEKVMNFNTGLLLNIILGIVGAMLGNFLLGLMGTSAPVGFVVQLIVAVIGACILIWGYRAVKGSTA